MQNDAQKKNWLEISDAQWGGKSNEEVELLKELDKAEKEAEPPKDIWEILEERKKKGLFQGNIEIIQTRSFNLREGEHYFVVEDPKRRSVKCISCQVTHGTILESSKLTRYRVENGIIYLDGKALNRTPAKSMR